MVDSVGGRGGFVADNTGDVTSADMAFASSCAETPLVAVGAGTRASRCALAAASPLGPWDVLDFLQKEISAIKMH